MIILRILFMTFKIKYMKQNKLLIKNYLLEEEEIITQNTKVYTKLNGKVFQSVINKYIHDIIIL